MNFDYYYPHLEMRTIAKPDFTPLFCDQKVFANLVKDLSKPFRKFEVDKVVSPEAMGYVLGSAIALKLNAGLACARKKGKLPTVKKYVTSVSFTDYSKQKNAFEMNKSLLKAGDKVLIVDDWIETGGQMKALVKLVEKQDATVVGISVIGANRIRKTKSLFDNYELRCILDYTMNEERDLKARLDL